MPRLSIPRSPLTALVALAALCAPAQAQRPSGTLFLGARGGATAYGGELDSCADYLDPDFDEGEACEFGWVFSDLGFGVGAELGYQFTRGFGLSLGALYGQYPNLDRDDAFNPFTGAFGRLNEGDDVLQVQGLLRLNTAGRVAPYVELGGAVVFGQGQEVDGDGILGYGPVAGGGLDFLVGRQLALFVGVQGQLVFPDDAVDSSDPGEDTQRPSRAVRALAGSSQCDSRPRK